MRREKRRASEKDSMIQDLVTQRDESVQQEPAPSFLQRTTTTEFLDARLGLREAVEAGAAVASSGGSGGELLAGAEDGVPVASVVAAAMQVRDDESIAVPRCFARLRVALYAPRLNGRGRVARAGGGAPDLRGAARNAGRGARGDGGDDGAGGGGGAVRREAAAGGVRACGAARARPAQ